MTYAYEQKRAQHDMIVRWTAGTGVFLGLLGWISDGKVLGLALLGSWLLMALLFALCPPKPTDTDT